jgi:UMF1 family MFS transporter
MRQRDLSKRFTKQEKSWIFYDWANSVYATNIMAVIFPI